MLFCSLLLVDLTLSYPFLSQVIQLTLIVWTEKYVLSLTESRVLHPHLSKKCKDDITLLSMCQAALTQ
jgi:hypothetical protein